MRGTIQSASRCSTSGRWRCALPHALPRPPSHHLHTRLTLTHTRPSHPHPRLHPRPHPHPHLHPHPHPQSLWSFGRMAKARQWTAEVERKDKEESEQVCSARTVPATCRHRTFRRALPARELSRAERLIGKCLRPSSSPNHTGDCDPREFRCPSRRGRASEIVTSARGDGVQ